MAQSKRLELSNEESLYLDDILSIWIDGYKDAQETALTDPMIKQAEELLETTGSLKEQEIMATMIRSRLREDN